MLCIKYGKWQIGVTTMDKLTDKEVVKDFTEKTELIGSMSSVYLDEDKGLELYEAMRNILILINRLQADCENYKQVTENQQKITLDRGFEIKELKAEVERLKKENDDLKNGYFQKRYKTVEHLELMGLRKGYADAVKERDYFQLKSMNLEEDIKTAKAEAYKEFAERLKKWQQYSDDFTCYAVAVPEIDNLLKELVGEDNS